MALVAACGGREGAPAARLAKPAAIPPPVVTVQAPAPAEPPLWQVHVHFDMGVAAADGTRTLFVVLDELKVREAVKTVPGTFRCEAVEEQPYPERRSTPFDPGRPAGGRHQLVARCGGGGSVAVRVEAGALTVDERTLPTVVPSTAAAVYDAALHDTPRVCPPDAAGPILDVSVTREGRLAGTSPDDDDRKGRRLHVRIPGVLDESRWLDEPAYCHAHRYGPRRMMLSCSVGTWKPDDTGFPIEMRVHDDALFVGPPGHGGYALPCGARVRFPRVHETDPHWMEHQFQGVQCRAPQDLCVDGCTDRMSDDAGELTDEGQACVARCDQVASTCVGRAMAGR
ncbi:MAG TPA: hypothetical protein VIF09_21170 [Polyangiaceae bacterium]|jgi:hypothetical protein